MANHFSAIKRARQTETRTVRNRSNSSRLRSELRGLREALAKGDKAAAEKIFRKTVSALDKAIQKGVLHKNTAARYKSRLSARLKRPEVEQARALGFGLLASALGSASGFSFRLVKANIHPHE